jgi:hypothetical protein
LIGVPSLSNTVVPKRRSYEPNIEGSQNAEGIQQPRHGFTQTVVKIVDVSFVRRTGPTATMLALFPDLPFPARFTRGPPVLYQKPQAAIRLGAWGTQRKARPHHAHGIWSRCLRMDLSASLLMQS